MVVDGRLDQHLGALVRIAKGGNGISGQDVEKAHALLAAHYGSSGDRSTAERHLRAIQFGGPLRYSAQKQLETE